MPREWRRGCRGVKDTRGHRPIARFYLEILPRSRRAAFDVSGTASSSTSSHRYLKNAKKKGTATVGKLQGEGGG